MKMVKSLLLGSAAGLVAVTAGQAADLPVKAKPVEYVKICSLYGAGFYYMPGTDMCIKIGGYARAETTYNSNGNFTAGPTSANLQERSTSNFVMRARAYITADSREQTAYGTARAYVAVGVATTDTGSAITPSILGFNRAFVQWAGITAGITQSFYDFYSSAAVGYRAYNPSSDTGDAGWWVWAYTAQMGNGLTATISAEQRRTSQIIDVTNGATATTLVGLITDTSGYGGIQSPDIVGNIRIDQTWGSAQIMGALHEVNAPYYSTVPGSGHPSDQWGFAVGAGLRLNFPMVAQGDFFQTQVNYTQGGERYVADGNNAANMSIQNGNQVAFGVTSDCVYGFTANVAGTQHTTGGTGCGLTTAWGVNASYEHYWTPQFHESFFGSWWQTRYDSQANNSLCAFEGFNAGVAGGASALAAAGCNNNWDLISAGTRFQYNFTNSLYFGVELLYQHLDSAQTPGNVIGAGLNTAFTGATASTPVSNMNTYSVTARLHKDFLP
jgi:Porin subfamily